MATVILVLQVIAWASAGAGALWLIASVAIDGWLLFRRRKFVPPQPAPPVTLIRPLAGLEYGVEDALRTSFTLTYPDVRVLFCVEDEDDPIIPLVRRLLEEHPGANAQLLVGRDRIGVNPKINNSVKGWDAARTDWVASADSNAILRPSIVEELLARWAPNVAVVSTPTLIVNPIGFAAELEAAFVNTFHTRTSLTFDRLGVDYVLSKSWLWRRDTLARIGGLATVAAGFGDDVLARQAVASAGMRARLARPMPHAVGRRTFSQVWKRQLRWMRVIRETTPRLYVLSILLANVLPFGWVALLATLGTLPWITVPLFIAAWYAIEALLAWIAGWPLSWRSPFAFAARDILYLPLWFTGLFPGEMVWRGRRGGPSTAGPGFKP